MDLLRAPSRTGDTRRERPLRSYLHAMVAIFVVVTAAGVVYDRARSTSDAGRAATNDAAFGADLAARRIDLDLESIRTMVAGLAANPQISQSFGAGGAGCTLDFSGSEAFATGHLDIIATDGGVPCSSQAVLPNDGHQQATWLPAALANPAVWAPVVDGRSGKQVVVVSSPIPGGGAVAAFLDLDALGPGLLASYGGPRGLEFLVATGDGQRAVTRSIDAERWVGAPLAGTAFADGPGASLHRDVDGRSRFYASASVEATGWSVYAGADRNQALATARALNQGDLIVAGMMLLVVVAAGFVVARRISLPIVALSRRVSLPFTASERTPVPVGGPREIADLGRHLNRLTQSLHDELEATARGAAIVESSNDSIVGWTPSGIITTWNPRSEQMYGYPEADAVGHDMSLIVPADSLDELGRLHQRVLEGEQVEPLETQKVRRDGSLVDVSVTLSPIRDLTGTIVGLSSVGRDITGGMQTVEALRSSEARKGAILDSALDAIVTMNHEGRIEEFNHAAERTFGLVAADVIGRPLSDVIIPAAQRDAHDRGLERFLATGERRLLGRCTEVMAMRGDGSLFPAEVTINEVDLPGSTVFTGFIRDVTERKAAEAARLSLEDRLHQSQRLESLGQLAGGVAHDFNNLLAVILNYASFVAEDVPDDPAVQFDVEQILSASERAAALTRQLLMFARREPVQPEILDLNAVVEHVRGLLARSIGEQIDLVVKAGADLPAIRADRGQTEQILLNLAVNARDAMPNGGVLTIDTLPVEIDLEYVEFHPGLTPGAYVQLSVSDSGTGMAREVASRAFEPFFTTKAKTEGSGLGLATVYGIITEAGGSVNLYSEEGLGTTVKVYFPATTDAAAATITAPRLTPIRGHGETILVVEDQDAVRAVTVRILRRNGYTVVEAASGQAALDCAASLTGGIDLLLTDVVMPKMSGRELAEGFKVDRPELPVLFMSGYSQSALGSHRVLDDDVALIQKPFNEIQLLRSVHEAITAGAGATTRIDAEVSR